MNFQAIEALERRRRNIRIILFVIILGTLPFYCAGFLLWGTAPRQNSSQGINTATFTPIGRDVTPSRTPPPTSTPVFASATPITGLQPTPLQFVPPPRPTATLTVFIPPTDTLAPTLTPYPTNTSVPAPTNTPVPTNTPLPLPSDTPLPTDVPPTDPPPPTDVPPTDPPPPTDVPLVPATDTPTV